MSVPKQKRVAWPYQKVQKRTFSTKKFSWPYVWGVLISGNEEKNETRGKGNSDRRKGSSSWKMAFSMRILKYFMKRGRNQKTPMNPKKIVSSNQTQNLDFGPRFEKQRQLPGCLIGWGWKKKSSTCSLGRKKKDHAKKRQEEIFYIIREHSKKMFLFN